MCVIVIFCMCTALMNVQDLQMYRIVKYRIVSSLLLSCAAYPYALFTHPALVVPTEVGA